MASCLDTSPCTSYFEFANSLRRFGTWKFCFLGQCCVQRVLHPTRDTGSRTSVVHTLRQDFFSFVRRRFRCTMGRRGWTDMEVPTGWLQLLREPRPPAASWPKAKKVSKDPGTVQRQSAQFGGGRPVLAHQPCGGRRGHVGPESSV